MNKVMLMGRLTKDPEARYSQTGEGTAVTRYTLAVDRRFKKEGGESADFINVVAFGKSGEFADKYFKKGQMVAVSGKLQVSSWTDKEGNKRWSTDVIVEEQFFTGSKNESGGGANMPSPGDVEGFYPIDDSVSDDDLPF